MSEHVTLETVMALVKSDEQFPVDFEEFWRWCGWTRKDSAKDLLTRNFKQDIDFIVSRQMPENPSGGRPAENIRLTNKCAKKMAMMARTEKGDEVREYYLKCETIALSPPSAIPDDPDERALVLASAVQRLIGEKRQLQAKIEADAPKIETYEAFLDATGGITINEFAKVLGLKPNKLFDHLRHKGVLMTSKTGTVPYQAHAGKGLFLTRQQRTPAGTVVTQTLLTPRGEEWLRRFLIEHPMPGTQPLAPPPAAQTPLFLKP